MNRLTAILAFATFAVLTGLMPARAATRSIPPLLVPGPSEASSSLVASVTPAMPAMPPAIPAGNVYAVSSAFTPEATGLLLALSLALVIAGGLVLNERMFLSLVRYLFPENDEGYRRITLTQELPAQ